MQLSPLQLHHYHIVAISIASNDDWLPEDSAALNGNYPNYQNTTMGLEVELGEPETPDPKDFIIKMHLTLDAKDGLKYPYAIDITLEGSFTIAHDGELEERKKLVLVNGCSMLYGAMREQILFLTARSKNGPAMVPSMNLRSLEVGPSNPDAPKTGPVLPHPPIKHQ